jgi:hypothetical protein
MPAFKDLTGFRASPGASARSKYPVRPHILVMPLRLRDRAICHNRIAGAWPYSLMWLSGSEGGGSIRRTVELPSRVRRSQQAARVLDLGQYQTR